MYICSTLYCKLLLSGNFEILTCRLMPCRTQTITCIYYVFLLYTLCGDVIITVSLDTACFDIESFPMAVMLISYLYICFLFFVGTMPCVNDFFCLLFVRGHLIYELYLFTKYQRSVSPSCQKCQTRHLTLIPVIWS